MDISIGGFHDQSRANKMVKHVSWMYNHIISVLSGVLPHLRMLSRSCSCDPCEETISSLSALNCQTLLSLYRLHMRYFITSQT